MTKLMTATACLGAPPPSLGARLASAAFATALLFSSCFNDTRSCGTGIEIGRSYRVTILGRTDGSGGTPAPIAYTCGENFDLAEGSTFELKVESKIEDSISCDSRLATPSKVPRVEIAMRAAGPQGRRGLMTTYLYRVTIAGTCKGSWYLDVSSGDSGNLLREPPQGQPRPIIVQRVFETGGDDLPACLRPGSSLRSGAVSAGCQDFFGARLEPL